jgi:hypothetical protein
MQSRELVKGKAYAWSANGTSISPELVKVKFLGVVRSGQVRVRWMEGELRDLEEWVSVRQLLCSWADRKALLRDREQQAVQDADTRELFDRVVERAISDVLTATGEEGGFTRTWALSPEKSDRLWSRAKLDGDPRQDPFAYVDRFGTLHLGFRSALRFARAFATAEPEACLRYVQSWERRLEAEGHLLGAAYRHDYLRELNPSHALVRQWAGDAEVESLMKEVSRLQSVVARGVALLHEAGHEQRATMLEDALHGR